MMANHLFWQLMLFYTHLLLLLQPSVMWLYIVTFSNHAKLPPKWILSKFGTGTNLTPARWVTPPWNVYMAKFNPGWEGYPIWQTWLSALVGHPTYHVNVIKLKWEIIWTGRLLHLSGLPHLLGSPTSMWTGCQLRKGGGGGLKKESFLVEGAWGNVSPTPSVGVNTKARRFDP